MSAFAQSTPTLDGQLRRLVNDAIAEAQVEIKKAVDEEAKALGLEGGIPDVAGLGSLLG